MLDVADLPNRGSTIEVNLSNFSGGQADLPPVAFLGHQLSTVASRTNHLSAASYVKTNVVNGRTERNVAEGKTVTRLDVSLTRRHDGVANLQTNGPQNVPLFAISVVQQNDACATVWIVFDACDLRWHANLVAAKIDGTKAPLVPTATESRGDAPEMIPPACGRFPFR
jgi:hypothetical protein